ncbi:MAG: hypothetical protein M0T81_01275 [Thermoplasmatales archaeon]|jgi:hypothetical protein|nr:hypothetical protein [Thermoplasmatales archaeon]
MSIGIAAFFSTLATKIVTISDWFKVLFKDEKGGKREASPEVITKYGKMRAEGDINVTNINPTIIINPRAPGYSKEELSNIVAEVGRLISDHLMGLEFDENFDSALKGRSSAELTDEQRNKIKLFQKAGWSRDKIGSLATAFRIANLEDSGKTLESSFLMREAFDGRKEEVNRKLYNLTRAGYIDRFALDLTFQPLSWTDENISKILDYFPDAVFLDQDFIVDDMVKELLKREKDSVTRVTLYARGKGRIEIMEKGYNQYLSLKISTASGDDGKRTGKEITLFMFDRKLVYKIGDTDAEAIDLYRKDLILRN